VSKGTNRNFDARNTLVYVLAAYTNRESHNAQRYRQTDGQQAAGNSRSYCVAVRSAKNYAAAKNFQLLGASPSHPLIRGSALGYRWGPLDPGIFLQYLLFPQTYGWLHKSLTDQPAILPYTSYVHVHAVSVQSYTFASQFTTVVSSRQSRFLVARVTTEILSDLYARSARESDQPDCRRLAGLTDADVGDCGMGERGMAVRVRHRYL